MDMTHLNYGQNQFSSKPMLYHLDNVSVYYNSFKALSNLSLVINQGEILFVTGASGAGKTTLLKTLAQDVIPQKGKITSNLSKENIFVAQVFQELKLMEDLDVKNNFLFSFDNQIYKNKAEFLRELDDLVNLFGMNEILGKKVTNLNRGAKQKVAIIRALLTRPEVFIADEPTSALDKDNANRLFEILNYYNTKRKMTIIWATHNKELVKQFPGRIIHLDKGRLIHSGNACFI